MMVGLGVVPRSERGLVRHGGRRGGRNRSGSGERGQGLASDVSTAALEGLVGSGRGGEGRPATKRETGVVGELAARLPDQPEHGLAGVAHHLAHAVEQHEAEPLGRASWSSSGRATRLKADSRLYRSTLRRNQAALAPNLWLGKASAASSLVST